MDRKHVADTVARIKWGDERRGGETVAIKHYHHNGWVFAGPGNTTAFRYDADVQVLEVLWDPRRKAAPLGVTINLNLPEADA